MLRKKFERKKEANFFGSKNQFFFSKLKSKEFADELIVHKVSELMHAWFTLRGKVKRTKRCPVNHLKLFAVQKVLCRSFLSQVWTTRPV